MSFHNVALKKILFNIAIFALIFCTIPFTTGCTEREEKASKKIEEQAIENAQNYISKKYGFDAEIISSKAEPNVGTMFSWDSTVTGYAKVDLKYDNKEFFVYISGENESTDGKDNYQQALIEEAIEQKFISLANINAKEVYCNIIYDYHISGYDIYNDSALLTGVYYNGNNIDEILNDINQDARFYIDYYLFTLNSDSKSHISSDAKSIIKKRVQCFICKLR